MSRISSREESLFADALALPPAERGAFLAKECGANVDLLAHLVALVAAHEGPESLTPPDFSPAVSSADGVANADVSAAALAKAEEKTGDAIGRYKLLQKIGEGGCGVVWMAEQEEPVRRRVALKVIKLGMDTKAVVARFEAERQALAMMDHPNIAKVHDAGSTDTGRPYFVMELVRGIPITKYCDENHLTPTARLELFTKVCQAIQHAHQKGVIHRDIKPSNILVTVNDGAPTPKVIDFGIAKATQGKLTDATVFTAFEQFIGTPVYMSPEQAEMSSLDIDTRSDIYSLGVLLYELLTGKPPFDPRAFAQAGVDQIRQQIREVEPPRPSARLRTLDEDERTTIAHLRGTAESQLSIALRGDLDWIVMRCIEKDRTRRYDTANGLAMDIQRYLRNEPVVARPPSTAYLLQKLIRRHRVGFAAAVTITATLMGGVLISTWQAVRARQAEVREAGLRRAAEMQEMKARQQAYAADMNLVQQALANDDLGRARRLLDRHRPETGQRDLRGWEWRYLWQFSHPDPHSVLCRKPEQIVSLSISTDGNWLAVGEYYAGASVRHLRSGEEYQLPAGDGRTSVAFSPNDSVLAVSGNEPSSQTNGRRGLMLFWNVDSRRLERRIELDGEWSTGAWTSLHFSADGRSLVGASLGPANTVRWWDMPQCTQSRAFELVQPRAGYLADSFAVSRDFRRAAHHTPTRKEIRVVDLVTGEELWRARAADEAVAAMAFSPDGKMLASGSAYAEPAIRLWDADSGKEIGRLHGHRRWVSALLFFPDGRTLASASGDGTIRLWDVPGRRSVRTLRGHERDVLSLALHPDNVTLISGGRDGTVRVWDTASPTISADPETLPAQLITWQFAADGKSIVTLDREGVVAEWKGSGFQDVAVLLTLNDLTPGFTGAPVANYYARFSVGARLLAVGSISGSIQVWDVEHRKLQREIKSISSDVLPVDFLDQNTRLLVCERIQSNFREYDLQTGRSVAEWPGPKDTSRFGAGVSPDGTMVIVIGTSGNAILRNRHRGHATKFDLAVSWAEAPVFSSDGRFFSTGAQRSSPKIWETSSLREVAELPTSVEVNSVAFSIDGSRLAVGASGVDGMRIWELENHQPLLTLPAKGSLLRPVLFSPEGSRVGAISLGGILHLWRAPSWEEIAAAEQARPAQSLVK